ncbi:hypothetical protein F5Y12DRAFT_718153 [Xylaria sp. FL1777]|nr:hypothetical protein F5Y12DRAFT_718153 [Xylaria sp. FL1777]
MQPLGNPDSEQTIQSMVWFALLNEFDTIQSIVARTNEFGTMTIPCAVSGVAVENVTRADIDGQFIPPSTATYNVQQAKGEREYGKDIAEGKIQLGIWVSSWFNRVAEFLREVAGALSGFLSVLVLLVDRGGNTKSLKEAYRPLACLRDLVTRIGWEHNFVLGLSHDAQIQGLAEAMGPETSRMLDEIKASVTAQTATFQGELKSV